MQINNSSNGTKNMFTKKKKLKGEKTRVVEDRERENSINFERK